MVSMAMSALPFQSAFSNGGIWWLATKASRPRIRVRVRARVRVRVRVRV